MIHLTRRKLIAGLGAAIIVPKKAFAGFLINPFSFGAPAFSYRNTYTDATGATNYSFASSDIGTEHASRVVVVGVSIPGGSNAVVSSMTVNAVSATLAVAASSGNGSSAELWYAAVPTGTSVTIAVNGDAASNGALIHVWAGYPASATPVDTAADAAASDVVTLLNLAKTSGGFSCFVGHNKTSTFTVVLTQNGAETITEHYDASFDGDAHSSMSHVNTATTTTDDYTATWSGSDRGALAGATWA